MTTSTTETAPLAAGLTATVLDWLGVLAGRPDRALLDALVQAYRLRVPWDTSTRIVKRASTAATADCPRWPEEFWGDAIEWGGGGTCYESNYALFSLLRSLGYEGYLTLNDMRDVARPACHAAIVVQAEGERWLVDVGVTARDVLQYSASAPLQCAAARALYPGPMTSPSRAASTTAGVTWRLASGHGQRFAD